MQLDTLYRCDEIIREAPNGAENYPCGLTRRTEMAMTEMTDEQVNEMRRKLQSAFGAKIPADLEKEASFTPCKKCRDIGRYALKEARKNNNHVC